MISAMWKRLDLLCLLAAILIYLCLAGYQLDLPGLHHDEAQEAGLMAMQLKNGYPPTLFRNTSLVIANRAFPIMVQDYIGSLNVYLTWISFGLFGVSVESLRGVSLLIGVLTLIAAYGAARELVGRRAAAWTAPLLAVHPTFIFWTRQGVYITSYTLTLALASLWLLAYGRRTGKGWPFYLAAFLMGIGLWGKLLFLWFIAGAISAWIILTVLGMVWERFSVGAGMAHVTPLRYRILIGMAICFLIGVSPLLEYNRQSSGTFQSVFGNLDQSYYGVDNSDVGHNFKERLQQTPIVFESGHLGELGGLYPNPIGREWLYLSILACLIAAGLERAKRGIRLFLPLLVLLMIAQSSFTNTALWYTHFALVLPFMVMLGAVGADAILSVGSALVGRAQSIAHLRGIVVVGLLVMLAYEVRSVAQYHHALTETGGLRTHSDSIYRLVDYLDDYPMGQPVAALDWGIGPAVDMLTEGHSVPNEVFGYGWEADVGFPARLAPFLALDQSLYVLHVDTQAVFPRREAFLQAANANQRQLVLLTTIPDGQGQPYFEIWQTQPTVANSP